MSWFPYASYQELRITQTTMYMSECWEPEGDITGHVKGTNLFKSGFSKSELKGTHKNSTRIIGKKILIQNDFTWFEFFGILYIRS